MHLVVPDQEYLSSYLAALERGWSANTIRPEAAAEEAAAIRTDSSAFLLSLDDRSAQGAPIALPDGSFGQRLPSFRRWMWDGEFCGSIGLRWQLGSAELPPHCLGHIGYAVVPWKQGQGLATAALGMILPEAQAIGLPYLDLTTDLDNLASQRVIRANGGVEVEQFTKPEAYGATRALRFRVSLS